MEATVEKRDITQVVDLGADVFYDALMPPPVSNKDFYVDDDEAINFAIADSLQTSYQQELLGLVQDFHFVDADGFGKLTSGATQPLFRDSLNETGQSSSSSKNDPDFVCEICVDGKAKTDMFFIKGCTHVYCNECMVNYVAAKLQENISSITCPEPGCQGALEPEHCMPILPADVFDRWCSALCEAMILATQRFYCPYKGCPEMLIDDGGEVVRESECPTCRRLFCAQCKVPWHTGIGCEDFQKLHKDEREQEDIMLMNLAKNKKWRRCPNCQIFVERIDGCKYMKCRCRTAFCYRCGSTNIDTTSHYCHACNAVWD